MLRTIERVNLSKNAKFSEDWKNALKNDLKKQNLWNDVQLRSSLDDDDHQEMVFKARRKDHISHFLLRLAYCRTEETRRWFITHETDLFRFRLTEESKLDANSFMKANKMNFVPVCYDCLPLVFNF